MQTEYRVCEVRQDGRCLQGEAVIYGDTARLPWGLERIEPGAFGDVSSADVILNRQHDRALPLARTRGGLELIDNGQSLSISATLPNTREADDALELVRSNVLRGLSVEFVSKRERWDVKTRIIQEATLVGIGLVDTPAYPQSLVEARERAVAASAYRRRVWL